MLTPARSMACLVAGRLFERRWQDEQGKQVWDRLLNFIFAEFCYFVFVIFGQNLAFPHLLVLFEFCSPVPLLGLTHILGASLAPEAQLLSSSGVGCSSWAFLQCFAFPFLQCLYRVASVNFLLSHWEPLQGRDCVTLSTSHLGHWFGAKLTGSQVPLPPFPVPCFSFSPSSDS